MRTYRALLGLAGLLVASAASAALPPNAQRAAEFKAILDHYEVAGAFPGDEPIARVEYVAPDRYRVASARCVMDVRIVGRPMPRGMVGPRNFAVEPGRVVCRPR